MSATKLTREKNPNWKGGRSITSHGYVLIRVEDDHHLADVRGYAYEHRIVAENYLGRRLEPGELVHHLNGDRSDNRPQNLEVVVGNAWHYLRHRKNNSRRRPNEPNRTLKCKCGCGETFRKYDESGRPRRFVSGHNGRKQPCQTIQA